MAAGISDRVARRRIDPCRAGAQPAVSPADGRPHTRIREAGQWVAIHEDLRRRNPLQPYRDEVWAIRTRIKDSLARARAIVFKGRPDVQIHQRLRSEVLPVWRTAIKDRDALAERLEQIMGLPDYEAAQAEHAAEMLRAWGGKFAGLNYGWMVTRPPWLEQVAESLEPCHPSCMSPGRASTSSSAETTWTT